MRDRVRAAAIHLLCSLAVASAMAALVFLVWYPGSLAAAAGVNRIFLTLLIVDVVLGPLLTLVVFNKAKSSLTFDLGVIVALQLAALLYGVSVVYQGRPVWIVFNVDRFDLVRAHDIDPASSKRAKPEYQSMNPSGPVWIGAIAPADSDAYNKLTMRALEGGPDLPHLPEYYASLDQVVPSIRSRARPLRELHQFNPDATSDVSAIESKFPGEMAAYVPLKGVAQDLVVIVERQTGSVVQVVALNPW
ncbi:TfpX/TfpZ family type IV pilin accessory protein [Piscinibacterium candidicorallinum]|uniref:TfpX/TfpZ family type IV pilin accessory protein n=1 Tax=Piscinibacterium candidicorallinum TaxID=1793872 RepID=A0ABV7H1V5_9BURK